MVEGIGGIMEVVVQTEYQDVYRVKCGVLLVVNKFEWDESYGGNCFLHSVKSSPYNKLTKDLRITKEDRMHKEYSHITKGYEDSKVVPTGTVLGISHPVKRTSDESKWVYEIKTTSSSFSGVAEDIIAMLDEIKNLIIK